MTYPASPVKRLGDVFLGKMIQPDAKAATDVRAPYLRAAHVQPQGHLIDVDDKTMWFDPAELARHDLRPGDVVVVEGGAGYGRSAVVGADHAGWGFQNSIVRIRPRPSHGDGRFIDYALQAALRSRQIEVACFTSTIPHFTADKVGALPVPAPELLEQRAIADYLDRETAQIDALIGKQQQLIDTLRERRASMIDGWLRRLEGRSTRLKHYARIQTGVTLSGEGDTDDPEWPYLRVANVQVGYVDTAHVKTLRLSPTVARQSLLRRGDVLMTEGGDIDKLGRGSLWRGEIEPCLHQNHVFAVRPEQELDPRFLVYLLDAPSARIYFRGTARKTTNLASTNKWTLGNLPMVLPSITDQRSAVRHLDEQTAKIDTLIQNAQRFIELSKEHRAALITAAVTGQIDVRKMA